MVKCKTRSSDLYSEIFSLNLTPLTFLSLMLLFPVFWPQYTVAQQPSAKYLSLSSQYEGQDQQALSGLSFPAYFLEGRNFNVTVLSYDLRHKKNHSFILSGSIFSVKANRFLNSVIGIIEIEKYTDHDGLGLTGSMKWNLEGREQWKFCLDGALSGLTTLSVLHLEQIMSLRNEPHWNFEIQIGARMAYQFYNSNSLSIGVRHSHIVNRFTRENPVQPYFNSKSGFISLAMKF